MGTLTSPKSRFRSGDETRQKRGGPDLAPNRVTRRFSLKNGTAIGHKNHLPTYKPFAFLTPNMLRGVQSLEDSLPKGIGDTKAQSYYQ